MKYKVLLMLLILVLSFGILGTKFTRNIIASEIPNDSIVPTFQQINTRNSNLYVEVYNKCSSIYIDYYNEIYQSKRLLLD